MIACAILSELLQKPREGLLAFCGAYIHDLARETDGTEPDHGLKAVNRHFILFDNLWNKYQITPKEKHVIKQAIIQHSTHEWMTPQDEGYNVMAILKDADALDRCRIGHLMPEWLRYDESLFIITTIKSIYNKTYLINEDINFKDFLQKI